MRSCKKNKGRWGKILICAYLLVWMGGCQSAQEESDLDAGGDAVALIDYTLAQEDSDTSWSEEDAVYVELLGDHVTAESNAIVQQEELLYIQASGTYVLSGSWQGSIIVDTGEEDVVRIVFRGVNVTAQEGSALYVKNARKTVVILAEDTQNTLMDAASYTGIFAQDEVNAALFSKADLSITGEGTLYVTGSYQHAVFCKDVLAITGGVLQVQSVNDGIKGKDGVIITQADITVEAGGEGICANEDQDADWGWIWLIDGTYSIASDQDAIQAQTVLKIDEGSYAIVSGDGVKETLSYTEGFDWDTQQQETSKKGLKADSVLWINGGSFVLNCEDDALHTDGTCTIQGGDFQIRSGDDGIHADQTLNVQGGNLQIEQCYEGLESADIRITAGTITIAAMDDGINAAAGSQSSKEESACTLAIEGGDIVIDVSYGDGIDSNGSITMSAGTLLIYGAESEGNSAIDYEGTFVMSGGVLAASGMRAMAQMPSECENQAALMIVFTSVQSADTILNLSDEEGLVLRFCADKRFDSLVLCAPALTSERSYTLSSGGTCEESDALVMEGTLSDESDISTLTLEDAITALYADGSAYSGAMGFGNEGGMGMMGPMDDMMREEPQEQGGQQPPQPMRGG